MTSLTWNIDWSRWDDGRLIDIYAVPVYLDDGEEAPTFRTSVQVHQKVITAALFDQFTRSLRSFETSNLFSHHALDSLTECCGLLEKATAHTILYLNPRMAYVSWMLSSQIYKQENQETRNTVCQEDVEGPTHSTKHYIVLTRNFTWDKALLTN